MVGGIQVVVEWKYALPFAVVGRVSMGRNDPVLNIKFNTCIIIFYFKIFFFLHSIQTESQNNNILKQMHFSFHKWPPLNKKVEKETTLSSNQSQSLNIPYVCIFINRLQQNNKMMYFTCHSRSRKLTCSDLFWHSRCLTDPEFAEGRENQGLFF